MREMQVPKPRGRPRQFDEQLVRQAILQSFWENGYSATSLDDLSKATGLVRPSLYGAFGSKSAMYLMSMNAFFEQLETARAALSSAQNAEKALETFFIHMLDVYVGNDAHQQLGCFLVGTALTEAPSNDKIRHALAERLGRLNQLLATALRVKVPNAESDDIEFAAEQATATLHSLAVRARAGENKVRLTVFAQRSARFITCNLN